MSKADAKIVATRKLYLNWSFRENFKRAKQFCNGAMAIDKEKCKTNLHKWIYIGTSIFDLSKVLIQDFDYNYIKNKYGDKAEILLTDTDSLVSKIVIWLQQLSKRFKIIRWCR